MAEEVNLRNQEKLLETQLRIAECMKVNQESIDILRKVDVWQKREWLYVCALDGMPADKIRVLQESKASTLQIRKAKQDFLSEKYAKSDALQKNVESLQREVQAVFKESREARNTIENGLEAALKKQAQAQEETIRAKDQIIGMLNLKISDLERQVQAREEATNQKMEDYEKYLPAQKTVSSVKRSEAEEFESEFAEPQVANGNGIFQKLASIRKSSDIRRFIDRYIKDDNITSEQKDFLLDCLEEGMSIKEVEKLAAPGLSIDVMKRIKNLQIRDQKAEKLE